jgi:hypothetical protein
VILDAIDRTREQVVAGGETAGHPTSADRERATEAAKVAARTQRRVPLSVVAAVLLVASLFFPYWQITLYAPQYPGGLRASVHLTHLTGDVHEINILNHYIGMKALDDAARLERAAALPAVLLFAAALALSARVRRFRAILRLPAITFPVAVVVGLAYWLWHFGHSMDPRAPIRLEPFMPVILGRGEIAQFSTVALFGPGFLLALASAGLVIYELVRERRLSGRGAAAQGRGKV